ncbi:hypothetical protein [Cryobacterium fucosi]|uniref:Minor tail protein n=1 Tax=Cryobacterium fucosi TaxID=1259157 RepID=A0A4R9B357_9MICO|nr:hypothetical protein [Cryobacterium fucosi]TFD74739.1 hypothetical protein E3T48_12500 [Cryobacterium fucosi]
MAALAGGSFQKWYSADLWYDGERRLQDVPVKISRLSDDDSRAVKTQGTATLTWTDDYGRSMLPVAAGDLFSPFGSELAVYAIVNAGTLQERIPMGWFQITDVPSMRDRTMFWNNRTITTGSTIEMALQDRLVQVQRQPFDVPSAPTILTSVWDEIGRVTGLQLSRTIADAIISRSVVYQEDRIQAVLDLADILGGVPYMAPDGSLAMRPKVWGAVVDTLRRGDTGTIVSIGRGMSAEGVYNQVVFRGQDDLQGQVLAVSEIISGPLRTENPGGGRSPAHRRPTFRSNQFVTTAGQAKAYTDSELARASLLSVRWPITEVWNPLREVGDVVNVVDEQGKTALCRVVSIDRDEGPTQETAVIRA